MLFASRCPGCDVVGPAPCRVCVAAMSRASEVSVPAALDGCQALLDYEGPAREIVAQLKYRNARAPAEWLAEGLASLVPAGSVDVITWAPTTDERRRQRGFDHAELLARRAARRCGIPCWHLLRRTSGDPQTGHTRLERRQGPVFTANGAAVGLRVLVIDDVVTTGATLDAAGRALREVGSSGVWGLAAAHPS